METAVVSLDYSVPKIEACKFLLEVTKFQLPTVYNFSTEERKLGCGHT